MNSYKTIRLETADHISVLTFNRAQTMNSITPQFMDELGAAIREVGQDAESRAVIITGSGRGFSSGIDLNFLGQAGGSMSAQELRTLVEHWQDVLHSLENLPRLTVAAVNGVALGAGLELLLCCDFRIASTRAFFGLPEVQFGIIPDLGGITRLTRTVGPAWAKEVVFRARNLSAMEALRIGLINRVAEPGDLTGTARKWAGQFAALPPSATRVAKQLINTCFDHDLTEGLRQAEEAQLELVSSDEFRMALKAAMEQKTAEARNDDAVAQRPA